MFVQVITKTCLHIYLGYFSSLLSFAKFSVIKKYFVSQLAAVTRYGLVVELRNAAFVFFQNLTIHLFNSYALFCARNKGYRLIANLSYFN